MKELKAIKVIKDWHIDLKNNGACVCKHRIEERVAIVDDDMFEVLSEYSWHITGNPIGKFYFGTQISGRRCKTVLLHQFVIGMPIDRKMVTDHIDGDSDNYRRSNLEIVTQRQNLQNLSITQYSKLPGVTWNKSRKENKFISHIRINGKSTHIGYFPNQVEAFFAYKAAVESLGEFIMPYVLEKCYKIIDAEMVHI